MSPKSLMPRASLRTSRGHMGTVDFSTMDKGRASSCPMAASMAPRICGVTPIPSRKNRPSIRPTREMRRCPRLSSLISHETKSTPIPRHAAPNATFAAKAVFPSPGRAARTINSPGMNPPRKTLFKLFHGV